MRWRRAVEEWQCRSFAFCCARDAHNDSVRRVWRALPMGAERTRASANAPRVHECCTHANGGRCVAHCTASAPAMRHTSFANEPKRIESKMLRFPRARSCSPSASALHARPSPLRCHCALCLTYHMYLLCALFRCGFPTCECLDPPPVSRTEIFASQRNSHGTVGTCPAPCPSQKKKCNLILPIQTALPPPHHHPRKC